MALFTAIELDHNAAPVRSIVNVVEQVHCFGYSSYFRDGFCQGGGSLAGLQSAHHVRSAKLSKLEGSGDAQQVIPVVNDPLGIDVVPSHLVQRPIPRTFVSTPETCLADVL